MQKSIDSTPYYFAPDELVSASELREFIYCERAWFLSRQGHVVMARAQEHRAAGIAFHEVRAAAARKATSNASLSWAMLLLLTALAPWVANTFMNTR
jgi:hypothetical protein